MCELRFNTVSPRCVGDSSLFVLQVGLFPDVLERKVRRHFEEGDHVRFSEFLSLIENFVLLGLLLIIFLVALVNGRFRLW